MSKMSAKQGESTGIFNVSIKDLTDYTGYTCNMSVYNADTDTAVITATPITLDGGTNKYPVALTPAQTAGLTPDNYMVLVELEKSGEFRKEVSWPLTIAASLIPA